MSCSVAPSAQTLERLGVEAELAPEQERVGDHPVEMPAGVGIALLDRLGERRHGLDVEALLRRVEAGVLERMGERAGEQLHAAGVARRRTPPCRPG